MVVGLCFGRRGVLRSGSGDDKNKNKSFWVWDARAQEDGVWGGEGATDQALNMKQEQGAVTQSASGRWP